MTFLPVSYAPDRGPEACCEHCGGWTALRLVDGRFVCVDARQCARVVRAQRRAYGRGRLPV